MFLTFRVMSQLTLIAALLALSIAPSAENSAMLRNVVASDRISEINSDTRCLAETLYYEARNQSRQGKLAVGMVVLNRAASSKFPNNICGVVYQSMKRGTCQFSWACKNRNHINEHNKEWRDSVVLAKLLIQDEKKYRNIAPGALFFHNTSVKPNWAERLTPVSTIGSHIFYRI